MGVRRAVDIVLEIAQREEGRRIYTYGPLIHNPQTIELLKRRGIIPVKNIAEIEDKQNAILIIRAHGIAPAERKAIRESGIEIVDATCPKGGYVQAIIKKHAALDYAVLIVGDKEHPEVDGLLGYAGKRGFAVAAAAELDKLPRFDKVCVVAQTTQNLKDYQEVVGRIKELCPDTVVFNTICSSTEQRQKEILAMTGKMDAIFIVGGKNSANTRRLADLAQKQSTPTFHIETAEELEDINFAGYNRIGVSAGASTPNWIIDSVMDRIATGQRSRKKVTGRLFDLWVFSVKTDIYSAAGAGCLCLMAMILQNIPVSFPHIAIASFFVYTMHILNRLISRRPLGFTGSFREETYTKHEKAYLYAAAVCMILALLLAFYVGVMPFVFLLVISFTGAIYNMKIMPASWRVQSLKDLPGSKNIFMAIAWGTVAAILPAVSADFAFSINLFVAFIFTFGIVFIRSAMSDILEIQSDKLLGRETIPVLIGKNNTLIALMVISFILLFILFFSHFVGNVPALGVYLSACILYLWICFQLYDRKSGLSGAVMEGILETSYIIAGFCVLLWLIM